MSKPVKRQREKRAYISSASVLNSAKPLFDRDGSHKRRKTFGKRVRPESASFFSHH